MSADETRTIEVQRRILDQNDSLADGLRRRFAAAGTVVVNVVSGPGSGKTELLARTMTDLSGELSMAAVTGDLATENDAQRLSASGSPARQILTGTMCHLEADMVAGALEGWDLATIDVLFVENVGNLVCPGTFDLGEDLRVLLVATTEGDDKPRKYPTLTRTCQIGVINKIDLADAVGSDLDSIEAALREVQPGIEVLRTSARTGEGVGAWYDLLRESVRSKSGRR